MPRFQEATNCYTLYFNNSKTATWIFPQPYPRMPDILVSLNDPGNSPLYKDIVSKTAVTIRCQNAWTGRITVTLIPK